MKKSYKRKVYLLDEDILISGCKDKYGFHPDKGVYCGFDLQKLHKKTLGAFYFMTLRTPLTR